MVIRRLVRTLGSTALSPLAMVGVVVLSCAVAGAQGLARVDASPAPESPFVRVAREADASVVSIRVVRSNTRGGTNTDPMAELYRRFFPGEEGDGAPFQAPGSGTGFVVTADGHILTNDHVVSRADAVSIRFSGDESAVPATVVGTDPASDLAVLKVEVERELQPLVFGDSDGLRVGDWAVAVGNPFGNLAGSVTVGVVSATGRRDLAIHGGAPRYQDFLQTDAAINFGNSGGPLLDIAGRVIGVNTAVNRTGQGIGFAIPANYARRIFEQLAAHGRVIRGWIGVDAGDHRRAGVRAGASIETIAPGSPAASVDLREHDVIVAVDGEPVADARDLLFIVSEADPGRELVLSCLRDDAEIERAVTVSEEPAAGVARPGRTVKGLTLAPLDGSDPRAERLREVFGTTAERGVMVLAVKPDTPADRAGIRPGDVIIEVNERPVANVDDVESRIADMPDGAAVTLLIDSGGQRTFVSIDESGS